MNSSSLIFDANYCTCHGGRILKMVLLYNNWSSAMQSYCLYVQDDIKSFYLFSMIDWYSWYIMYWYTDIRILLEFTIYFVVHLIQAYAHVHMYVNRLP